MPLCSAHFPFLPRPLFISCFPTLQSPWSAGTPAPTFSPSGARAVLQALSHRWARSPGSRFCIRWEMQGRAQQQIQASCCLAQLPSTRDGEHLPNLIKTNQQTSFEAHYQCFQPKSRSESDLALVAVVCQRCHTPGPILVPSQKAPELSSHLRQVADTQLLLIPSVQADSGYIPPLSTCKSVAFPTTATSPCHPRRKHADAAPVQPVFPSPSTCSVGLILLLW